MTLFLPGFLSASIQTNNEPFSFFSLMATERGGGGGGGGETISSNIQGRPNPGSRRVKSGPGLELGKEKLVVGISFPGMAGGRVREGRFRGIQGVSYFRISRVFYSRGGVE